MLKSAVLCLGYGLLLALICVSATQVLGVIPAVAIVLAGLFLAEKFGEHLSRLGFRPKEEQAPHQRRRFSPTR